MRDERDAIRFLLHPCSYIRLPFRNTQADGFGGVAVDNEIERDAAESAGEAIQGEVFHPDAGMKEFRLMAGEQKRPIGERGDRFARKLKILPGGGQGGIAGVMPQIREGPAQDSHFGVLETMVIGSKQVWHIGPGRLGQNRAVFLGRSQAARDDHRHVSLGQPIRDQALSAASRTWW